MTKEEIVNKLIDYFTIEDPTIEEFELPTDYEESRIYLDRIITIRKPNVINEDINDLLNSLLQRELLEKQITYVENIETIDDTLLSDHKYANVIALWKGDITTLKIDAIVNSANSSLLGCMIPDHLCVDNCIHLGAGINLRLECNEMMKIQDHDEQPGNAKITGAYNLPCKYIIHTIAAPIEGELNDYHKETLRKCYLSCLEMARKKEIKTIAFPCIATEQFHFPKNEAAIIALNTIEDYLDEHGNCFDKIVIDTYSQDNYNEYKKLL